MKSLAKHRYARISATKVRLVARMISGKPVSIALDELTFNKRKGATLLRKVLNSAISNAEHNQGADVDDLIISKVCVDEGPTMKRFRARARGRSSKIFKRTSHITVEVAEINE
jgi:large subunit ribosomal protein L22